MPKTVNIPTLISLSLLKLRSITTTFNREFFISLPKRIALTLFYHLGGYYIFNVKVSGIHLGCGNVLVDGFLNIDSFIFSCSNVLAGIKYLMVRSNSIPLIYNSHVLEHVPRHQQFPTLKEWYRVLKKNGKLYISTPDISLLFEEYVKLLKNYGNKENKYKIYKLSGIIYGGQYTAYDYHYYGYCYKTLRQQLIDIGFKKIESFVPDSLPFGNLNDASYTTYDKKWLSVNIVATK